MTNLDKLKTDMTKKFGHESVSLAERDYHEEVVSTGSLMLDYKSGVGGFPYGCAVEVYGENQVGKSSAVGYQVAGNVQRDGKLVVYINTEPRLVSDSDYVWARKMGFEPDDALLLYPDNAEEAFDMVRHLVFNEKVNPDYIIVDSVGGMGNASTGKDGGKTAKAYGISGALTAVLNDTVLPMYKRKIGSLWINQRRQSGNINGVTLYDSPGGEGIKHQMHMRIHLKFTRDKVTGKVDGEDVYVARTLAAQFVKNNKGAGPLRTAHFTFYYHPYEGHEVGIDKASDVINVAMLTNVVQASGTWLSHESFPLTKSGSHQIQGADKAGKYLVENPEAYAQVRAEVLKVMDAERIEARKIELDAEREELNGLEGE